MAKRSCPELSEAIGGVMDWEVECRRTTRNRQPNGNECGVAVVLSALLRAEAIDPASAEGAINGVLGEPFFRRKLAYAYLFPEEVKELFMPQQQ
jgi:hypothetical protein